MGNPVIAAVYDAITEPMERLGVADQRRRIGVAASGQVLEIGAGTGRMFPYYGDAVDEVVATEPDAHMRRRAEAAVGEAAVPVMVQDADAQVLPFDDATFDTVVVALALCTIPDPRRALREVRRVLRPDGQLLFVEHVRSRNPAVASLQTTLTPVWRPLAGGCHLDRPTADIVAAEGFALDTLWRSGEGRGSLIQGRAVPTAG